MNYCGICSHFKETGSSDGPMPLGFCYGKAWKDGEPEEIRADAIACGSFVDVEDTN
ncbi:hypothetical protein ACLBWT_14910 [Paenibacillus sp. D51F]